MCDVSLYEICMLYSHYLDPPGMSTLGIPKWKRMNIPMHIKLDLYGLRRTTAQTHAFTRYVLLT